MTSSSNQQKWCQATLQNDFKRQLAKLLVSFFATDKDGYTELIGTGFILSAQGKNALVMTAAHNFDFARKIQKPKRISHPSTLPEFQVHKGEIFSVDKDKLGAVYISDEHIDTCQIKGVTVVPELDIALCAIQLQEHCIEIQFKDNFALDTRSPEIGDDIVVIGYSGLKMLKQKVYSNKSRFFQIQQKIEMLRGKVTEVSNSGLRNSNWPCFETTIPIVGGMSGSPVVYLGDADSSITVCGVVSKDISPKEAFNSFYVSGHSIMAQIWPSIFLPFGCELEGENKPFESNIYDLIKKRIIKDAGNAPENSKMVKNNDNTITVTRIDKNI